MKMPIYLDYAATTPLEPRVAKAMIKCMRDPCAFGNAASQHTYGDIAREKISDAREKIATVVGASPSELIFTSGATESNNIAILGAARFYGVRRKKLVTMATEHQSVLACFHALEREGFAVCYLKPDRDGVLPPERLQEQMSHDVALVSIMHVNNETGIMQPIANLGKIAHDFGALFHVDAAQSAGKLPIQLNTLPVDLMSFSGHKNYGPQGIGALYIRKNPVRVRLSPPLFGGGQEQGLRSGTLPLCLIIGMGEAYAYTESIRNQEQARITQLSQILCSELANIPSITLNGNPGARVPAIHSLTFHGITTKTLLSGLSDIAVSHAAACSTAKYRHSHVLEAMGLDSDVLSRTIRLTLGRFTTSEDIAHAVRLIRNIFNTF